MIFLELDSQVGTQSAIFLDFAYGHRLAIARPSQRAASCIRLNVEVMPHSPLEVEMSGNYVCLQFVRSPSSVSPTCCLNTIGPIGDVLFALNVPSRYYRLQSIR